jgi:hypothetical protein
MYEEEEKVVRYLGRRQGYVSAVGVPSTCCNTLINQHLNQAA